MARVSTCLWLDGVAEDAAKLYVSLIQNSRITSVYRPKPDGPPLIVNFSLDGTPYQALNGGRSTSTRRRPPSS